MSQPSMGAPPWAAVYQIGLVVRDLDAACAHFERLGIGPFRDGPSGHTVERHVHGKLAPDVVVRGRITQLGPIEFELMSPVSGASIQQEWLDEHGEGVMHICIVTDDIDRDTSWMAARETQPIAGGELADGSRFAHFDTAAIGGLLLEIFQPGPDYDDTFGPAS